MGFDSVRRCEEDAELQLSPDFVQLESALAPLRLSSTSSIKKNPAQKLSGVHLEINSLFLFVLPFGCLERVDLCSFLASR